MRSTVTVTRVLMSLVTLSVLVFNFISIGSAGDLRNQYFDQKQREQESGTRVDVTDGWNAGTEQLLDWALISALISLCSCAMTVLHLYKWNYATKTAASAINVFSFTVSIVAFGFAVKVFNMGDPVYDASTVSTLFGGVAPDLENRVSTAATGALVGMFVQFGQMCGVALFSADLHPTPPRTIEDSQQAEDERAGWASKGARLVLFLSVFSFVMYVVRLILATAVYNEYFNAKVDLVANGQDSDILHMSPAALEFLSSTIATTCVAGASTVVAILHSRQWNAVSMCAAVVSALPALGMHILDFGYAAKVWQQGDISESSTVYDLDNRISALSGFSLIGCLFVCAQTFIIVFVTGNLKPVVPLFRSAKETSYYALHRLVVTALMFLSLLPSVGRVFLSAKYIDDYIDEEMARESSGSSTHSMDAAKNVVTDQLIKWSLMAGAVGISFAFYCVVHLWHWTRVTERLSYMLCTSYVFISLIPFGYAMKQQSIGDPVTSGTSVDLEDRLVVLAWLSIAQLIITALMWLALPFTQDELYLPVRLAGDVCAEDEELVMEAHDLGVILRYRTIRQTLPPVRFPASSSHSVQDSDPVRSRRAARDDPDAKTPSAPIDTSRKDQ